MPKSAPATHACNSCHKSFARRGDLTRHEKTHDPNAQKFRCKYEDCGHWTLQKSNLDGHYNWHEGSKPHKCFCGKAYKDRAGLSRHRKSKVHYDTSKSRERTTQQSAQTNATPTPDDDATDTDADADAATPLPHERAETHTPQPTASIPPPMHASSSSAVTHTPPTLLDSATTPTADLATKSVVHLSASSSHLPPPRYLGYRGNSEVSMNNTYSLRNDDISADLPWQSLRPATFPATFSPPSTSYPSPHASGSSTSAREQLPHFRDLFPLPPAAAYSDSEDSGLESPAPRPAGLSATRWKGKVARGPQLPAMGGESSSYRSPSLSPPPRHRAMYPMVGAPRYELVPLNEPRAFSSGYGRQHPEVPAEGLPWILPPGHDSWDESRSASAFSGCSARAQSRKRPY